MRDASGGADRTQAWQPRTAVVVGASGGIGRALVEALADIAGDVVAASRQSAGFNAPQVRPLRLDLEDEVSISSAAAAADLGNGLDLVIVATGMLHAEGRSLPERRLADLDGEDLAHCFAINCIGPALVAKHMLPRLARDRRSVFAVLSARVGSITDNRKGGWYAYRASKAALNMFVKTAAIELARFNPAAVCLGLHPGTVATALSQPFQTRVPEGQLVEPDQAAANLLNVMADARAEQSGQCLAWDGTVVPA